MTWLLDTNAISELALRRMNDGIRAWFDARTDSNELFLSAVTAGELLRGALLLPSNHPRRGYLMRWAEDVLDEFGNRVLPFDTAVARTWAELMVGLPRGINVANQDTQIAATAAHHGHILVTRNVRDMSRFNRLVIESPWT